MAGQGAARLHSLSHELSGMDMKLLLLALALGALLAGAVGIAAYSWWGLAGVDIGVHGVLALALGVGLSLALGIGLMSLVFYSNRHGHDDEVGRF